MFLSEHAHDTLTFGAKVSLTTHRFFFANVCKIQPIQLYKILCISLGAHLCSKGECLEGFTVSKMQVKLNIIVKEFTDLRRLTKLKYFVSLILQLYSCQ